MSSRAIKWCGKQSKTSSYLKDGTYYISQVYAYLIATSIATTQLCLGLYCGVECDYVKLYWCLIVNYHTFDVTTMIISKHLYEHICSDFTCADLIHPWSKSCLKAAVVVIPDGIIGNLKFYSIIYLVQMALRYKKLMKGKEEWYKMASYYSKSVMFGTSIALTHVPLHCLMRHLSGKSTYNNISYTPSLINGIFIFFEPPHRRGIVVNLFSGLLIQYWLKKLQRAQLLEITVPRMTAMFMLGSALLFYLMRLEGEKKRRTPLFWMFTPEKVRNMEKTEGHTGNICPHKGSCLQFIFKGFSTMFLIGFGTSLAKVVLPKIRTPLKAVQSLKLRDMKLGAFLGFYIGIYRAVICCLCRVNGRDSASYAIPAGALAGLSFIFKPNLGMAISSLTGAFKLFSTILYEKGILPTYIPLPELLYCYCQGILFRASFFNSDISPGYVINVIRGVTNKRTDQVYLKILEKVLGITS